jgi:hypothetical protein
MSVIQRISDYLSSGGLFNPEMVACHDAVRDLLIDARAELQALAPDPTARPVGLITVNFPFPTPVAKVAR